MIRDPEAIECLATADLLILDHLPALERTELELDAVAVFPGHTEEKLLRYAAAAFHDLDDERAACAARRVQRPGDRAPWPSANRFRDRCHLARWERSHQGRRSWPASPRILKTTTAGRPPGRTKPEPPDSLMVGINGRVAGLIHFRRSDRLEAASALDRLRSKRNLQVGIVSESPTPTLAPLGNVAGRGLPSGRPVGRRSNSLSADLPITRFQGRLLE